MSASVMPRTVSCRRALRLAWRADWRADAGGWRWLGPASGSTAYRAVSRSFVCRASTSCVSLTGSVMAAEVTAADVGPGMSRLAKAGSTAMSKARPCLLSLYETVARLDSMEGSSTWAVGRLECCSSVGSALGAVRTADWDVGTLLGGADGTTAALLRFFESLRCDGFGRSPNSSSSTLR